MKIYIYDMMDLIIQITELWFDNVFDRITDPIMNTLLNIKHPFHTFDKDTHYYYIILMNSEYFE